MSRRHVAATLLLAAAAILGGLAARPYLPSSWTASILVAQADGQVCVVLVEDRVGRADLTVEQWRASQDLTPIRDAGLYREIDHRSPDLPSGYAQAITAAGQTVPAILYVDSADGDILSVTPVGAASETVARWRSHGGGR